ncbi:MAG: aromatic aminobenezylarsenical efflux permease ArsG family transporter [Tidjanibacter sp.]|nr:aromatic aminobenezylarsenical efflux permease ArsG family transporter [Tidjanibacter sp.]
MDFLHNLLDNSTTPILTAFVLGLLTAISPCPLATNITAIGYIGKDIGNRNKVFVNGLLYSLGRLVSYSVLGAILIFLLREGATVFAIQKTIGRFGEALIGPVLILFGLFMLFGKRLHIKGFGYNGSGEVKRNGWGAFVVGILFSLAFCPTSAVFYFGMLIPLSVTASAGYLLPAVFAIATALPVIVVAWIIAYGVSKIGSFYNRVQAFQRWANLIVAFLFIAAGIFFSLTYIL